MQQKLIDGVVVVKLRKIADERGHLMEILRNDDPHFEKFGQVYITTNYPGVVKGWHYHAKQTDFATCVHGMIKMALYDARNGSPTFGTVNEFFIGEHSPIAVKIPAGVYHGWKGISHYPSITVNTVTEVYNYENPDEFRKDWKDPEIPYDWDIKMG
ncbi:MAG: dTDP-4-dehydrorhamnose 3,5-epimerase family protein [bacterium]|nr:dTDP-4-dehydrorhamnose 3,5-epimerase family protein [bacterium]